MGSTFSIQKTVSSTKTTSAPSSFPYVDQPKQLKNLGSESVHEVVVIVIEEVMNDNKSNLYGEEQLDAITSIPSLEELENILGYKFNDQNLLREAYIHSSFHHPEKSSPSYERLEFIGDAILNMLIAKEVFFNYLELAPGSLTKLRAANVDNEKLARVAIKHGFHRFLQHKNSKLANQIRAFSEAVIEYPVHSNGLIDIPKILADVVESTIGAIFVDSNNSLETVWKVFKELLEPIINPETMGVHPITEINELCQKKGLKLHSIYPKSSHKKTSSIEVYIDKDLYGKITYPSGSIKKEIAYSRLAKKVLDKYRDEILLLPDHDQQNLTNN